MANKFKAVVLGTTFPDVIRECGHNHRTIVAAVACGDKLYNSHYEGGSWSANANWHNFTIQCDDAVIEDIDLNDYRTN